MPFSPNPSLTDHQNQAMEIFHRVQVGQLKAKLGLSDLANIEGGEDDRLILAVRGSLLLKAASKTRLPFQKLKLANQALGHLDKATSSILPSETEFLWVYLFAAISNASVAEFFDRGERAKKYFLAITEHSDFDQLAPNNLARIYAWQAKLEGLKTEEGRKLASKANEADKETAQEILNKK